MDWKKEIEDASHELDDASTGLYTQTRIRTVLRKILNVLEEMVDVVKLQEAMDVQIAISPKTPLTHAQLEQENNELSDSLELLYASAKCFENHPDLRDAMQAAANALSNRMKRRGRKTL